ncbi:MAG: twin-arginine translocase subunit TatC [Gemmatimonadota bacterium]|nr:MAG: twin-arginine translocase subunit TatC [Gemmatimonadota bacterium]
MSKKSNKGEMPFLDHLEELRWRILKSLGALIVGTVIGFLVVQNFEVLELLKEPIAPFLPEGKLHVTAPTDAFFVTLKLAVVIGLVLSAPVIIAQAWAFLLPALYEHERRYITPFLIAGLGLFIAGVLMAYLWVLPVAMRFLLTRFQRDYLEYIITATAYFGFVTQLILAFGLMFEVPILMVLLSAMQVVSPATFARMRPYALVVASVLAAMLTPPDVASMLMLMFPVVLLYEVGIFAARLVWKSRERAQMTS